MLYTYSITDQEFQEYTKNFYKKTLFKRYWVYLLIIGVIIFSNVYNRMAQTTTHIRHSVAQDSEPDLISPLINWLILIAILVGLWYFLVKAFTGKQLIKKQDRDIILGERTLTVDTEQVQSTTPTASTTYQWSAIKRWEQTTNLYLLYITSNAALILPKRVFKSEIEQEKFESLLKTKIQILSDTKYLDA